MRTGPVPVVYEDNHLLVVVKPANMPTQADASGDPDLLTVMKAYVAEKYRKPGAVYLGLVHRLDRPVTGLVVLARTSKAAERLSVQVREKTMNRQYLAVVRGTVPHTGELRDFLLKDERNNRVNVVPEGTGNAKEARLRYERLAEDGEFSLVRVMLETGRSHQIRVQMMHAGFPLWGDARYGGGRPGEQIALFGAHLELMHPTKKEPMAFTVLPEVRAPWNRFADCLASGIF